jgi:hypothetical protein
MEGTHASTGQVTLVVFVYGPRRPSSCVSRYVQGLYKLPTKGVPRNIVSALMSLTRNVSPNPREFACYRSANVRFVAACRQLDFVA